MVVISNTVAPVRQKPLASHKTLVPAAVPYSSSSDVYVSSRRAAPTRTAAEARDRANAVYAEPPENGGSKSPGTVVLNLRDINDPRLSPARLADARALIRDNQALESRALAAMNPLDRAKYGALAASLDADPMARLALQLLAVEGKLPGARTAADGGNLLDALSRLGDPKGTPLSPRIDRQQLLAETVQEVANPTAIDQQDRDCCVAAAAQIQFAIQNPADYVRVVNGLASRQGTVTLPNGQVMWRSQDTNKDDDSHRTISSRLVESAFMQYAGGRKYTDVGPGTFPNGVSGLTIVHLKKLVKALYPGHDFEGLWITDRSLQPGGVLPKTLAVAEANGRVALTKRIEANVKAGKSVIVALDWAKAGDHSDSHELLVTGVTADKVTVVNPWGRVEEFSRKEFEARLEDAMLWK